MDGLYLVSFAEGCASVEDGMDGSGRPISSKASRRAVCSGDSDKESVLPPGSAA